MPFNAFVLRLGNVRKRLLQRSSSSVIVSNTLSHESNPDGQYIYTFNIILYTFNH